MCGTLGAIDGVAEVLARRSSAIANLGVIGAGGGRPEHTHANPYLWLHVLGAHEEAGDCGERFVDGVAAMFFPAGSAHRMAVRRQGLISVIVEFDAGWLRSALGPGADLGRPRLWLGGEVGLCASRLARCWLAAPDPDARRFALTEDFLRWAMGVAAQPRAPAWIGEVGALIDRDDSEPSADALAESLAVSRARLARAYRRWRGEGLVAALRRRRVAAAAMLLETTDLPLAQVAIEAGFCDQSHMNRGFRRVVGRTPAHIRSARLGLASEAGQAARASA